jgi:hypothetical protein
MMNEPQSTTDPLDFPLAAFGRLLAACNEANDAFRAFFKAWGVDDKGQNVFDLAENKELFKVLSEKEQEYFQSGMTKIFAAVQPVGGVQ